MRTRALGGGVLLALWLAACAAPSPGPTSTPDASATTLWDRVVGTATALRRTAEAPASATPSPAATVMPDLSPPAADAPLALTLSAQPLNTTDYIVADTVRVSVQAPGAVSVIFFTAPTGTGLTPSPQFVDLEAGDGWVWFWTPPTAGWLGHVWAEAHYPDGSRQVTAQLLTISPDGLGTPSAVPSPGVFASLTPPPTATPPSAPPELTAGLTYQTDCAGRATRRAGWDITSPVIASPDGRWQAQSLNVTHGFSVGVRVAAADGAGEIWIPAPTQSQPIDEPLWSPDSQWLIIQPVALSQPGGGEIWKVRPDGSGLTWLARYLGYHDPLAWSPDGRYVAFTDGRVSGRGSGTMVGDYQVYVTPTDGSGQRWRVGAGCAPDWGTDRRRPPAGPTATALPAGAARILSFSAQTFPDGEGLAVTLTWEAEGQRFSLCPRLQTFAVTAGCMNDLPATGTRTVPYQDLLGNYTDFQFVAQSAEGVATAEAAVAVRCPGYETWFLDSPPLMCPTAPPLTTNAAWQSFEGGRLVWLEATDQFYILLAGQPGRLIPAPGPLALKPGGSPDNRVTEPPPAGRYEPVSGFGLLWRNEVYGGEGVREQLGWALEPEFSAPAIQQCEHSAGPTWNCYLRDPAGRVLALTYMPYRGYLWAER